MLNHDRSKSIKISLKFAFAGAIMLLSSYALAQPMLEEILVTAQKRAESLQDVSVSVSVTPGRHLIKNGLKDLETLSQQLPAINISKSGASDLLSIRGIRSGSNAGFEQSVGTYVDDIYIGRSRGTRVSFVDLEQIEILKGPQSLYFGNSSIAGALSLTSKLPEKELSGYVSALYEPSHGETNLETVINLPVSDELQFRLAARKYDLDGYAENTVTGEDAGSADDSFYRFSTLWEPIDNLNFLFKLAAGNSDRKDAFVRDVINCPSSFGTNNPLASCNAHADVFDNEANFKVQSGDSGFTNSDFLQASLNLSYDFGASTLTYVGGKVKNEHEEMQDIDSGPLFIFNARQYDELDQTSHEIRLTSSNDSVFEWMLGAYYQDGKVGYDVAFAPNFIVAPPLQNAIAAAQANGQVLGGRNNQFQDETTTSVFGSTTLNLSSRDRLVLGLRWIEVEKKLNKDITWALYSDRTLDRNTYVQTIPPFAGFATVGSITGSNSWNDVLPTMIWEHDLSSQKMIYFSFAQGFKAGGFDMSSRDGTSTPGFDAELADAYEIGFKGDFLNRSLRANLALFYSDYSNVQASVIDPNTFVFSVGNASASVTYGLEIDLQYAVNSNLELKSSIALMNAEYDEFIGSCNAFQTGNGICPNDGAIGAQDLSGHETTFAPSYSGNLQATYTKDLPNSLRLTLQPNIYFTDSYFIQQDFDPFNEQESYINLDLRVALASSDGRWEVALLGKNLTDEKTLFFANDLGSSSGSYLQSLNRPRSIAAQINFNF